MERKKATDFPQELLNMFDQYVHGDISRRQFLEGANKDGCVPPFTHDVFSP
jgi:carboxymethylenebutenolidase